MKFNGKTFTATGGLLVSSVLLLCAAASALGQVSPTEVQNLSAKADEQKYLPQLVSLQRAIGTAQLPFTFRLARYLDAQPGQRAASDSNGIEFVYFQNRVVLKISGKYEVAFDASLVNQNARASRTIQEVVAPVLQLVAQSLPPIADCEGIGFEIMYHTRDGGKAYDFEGREVLTLVFDRDDAFKFAQSTTDEERQEILDRADLFLNGKTFVAVLAPHDEPGMGEPDRRINRPTLERTSLRPVKPVRSGASERATPPPVSRDEIADAAKAFETAADAADLQTKVSAEPTARSKQGGPALHTEEGQQPSSEIQGDQRLLHFAMRNSLSFERQTSIYKRAAQSFDLFLAPELKSISMKLPTDASVDALHFSVINNLGPGKDETIEYICPMDSMRSFVDDKITSQELINKSKVLVNGVRIGLDLQLVE